MEPNRARAKALGQQAVRILEAGQYTNRRGETVFLADAVARSVAGTCSYPPEVAVAETHSLTWETVFEVRNESTLAAARRLHSGGLRPAALNFASARSPGGGFLNGARAQEESLARCSGLYACLVDQPMYPFHRARQDALYTHYVIYSPDVPVFCDDKGEFLDSFYLCSFLTSPAVNAKVILAEEPHRRSEIREVMAERIRKVLAVAVCHHHDALVLGAWGCGVFGNDCAEIAELFQQALSGPFHGAFRHVLFAVLDSSPNQKFIGPFHKVWAGQ